MTVDGGPANADALILPDLGNGLTITKTGEGILELAGSGNNWFVGPLNAFGGTVRLNKPGAVRAIPLYGDAGITPLVIGDNDGGPAAEQVVYAAASTRS